MNLALQLDSVNGASLVERALLNDIVHARVDQTSSEVPNAGPSLWI